MSHTACFQGLSLVDLVPYVVLTNIKRAAALAIPTVRLWICTWIVAVILFALLLQLLQIFIISLYLQVIGVAMQGNGCGLSEGAAVCWCLIGHFTHPPFRISQGLARWSGIYCRHLLMGVACPQTDCHCSSATGCSPVHCSGGCTQHL